MRRIFLCFVLFALVALGGGSSTAAAAPGQSVHLRLSESFAEALWETQTTNSITDTYIAAGHNKPGATFLFVSQTTQTFDNSGNFTGITNVVGEADSGVSFNIVNPLVSATASAAVPCDQLQL
jgi:hypothetical protein